MGPRLKKTSKGIREGRGPTVLRPLRITRGAVRQAEGSALVELGATRVLCAATIEDRVPAFLKGKSQGWVTAEYAMLPRASHERVARDHVRGGRALEISRLIGRSLRAITDLKAFGERTLLIDCDVLDADGGTRTAAIDGAFVALHDAFFALANRGALVAPPLLDTVAAVSVGRLDGELLLDLDYAEDAAAEVDLNVVMTGRGGYIEVQGTGEKGTFSRPELTRLLSLAERGLKAIRKAQQKALGGEIAFLRPAPGEGRS
jgi:ribonuclease PH